MLDLKAFENKKICVAISGGVDSVVLLHSLKSQAAACGFTLLAVHCEHGIRGESSIADMRFTQEYCQTLNVPLYVFRTDCPALAKQQKQSLETAAREFRRRAFAELIESGKAHFIATAHHAEDEAETVLFRLARGASLSGAKGMGERDGQILRPILTWTKTEIYAYAQKHNLAFCVDETNADKAITRNRLRLDVLPSLESCIPGASRNLAAFARRAAEDDGVLYELAQGLLQDLDEGILVAFCDKAAIFKRACLLALKGLGVEKDYTAAHLDGAFALQKSGFGARLSLPENMECVRTENGVLFRKKQAEGFAEKSAEKTFGFSGYDGGRYEVKLSFAPLEEGEFVGKILRMDGDKIPAEAVFRFKKDGDKLRKIGGANKTLKKLLSEARVPKEEREYLPLIAVDGEVLAVCGVEIAESVAVDERTVRTVYIGLQKKKLSGM